MESSCSQTFIDKPLNGSDQSDVGVQTNMREVKTSSHPRSEADSQTQLVSHNGEEFLKLDLPPRELLLSPWLPKQGIAMVYAPRGIGKTYFTLAVAYAAATAGEFLSWKAKERSRVVYLDGEMPAASMQERLYAMVDADPRQSDQKILDRLMIVSQEQQENGMPDLSSDDGQAIYDEMTDSSDLVIVDNISTLCRTGAENKGDDWNVVSQWALRMRREKRTVLYVHHTGKGGDQRGTSKREDILDTSISLRPPVIPPDNKRVWR